MAEDLTPLGGTLDKPDITLTNTPPVDSAVPAEQPVSPNINEAPDQQTPVESGATGPQANAELPLAAQEEAQPPQPQEGMLAGPGIPKPPPKFPRGPLGRAITAEASIKMSNFAQKLIEAPLEIGAAKYKIPFAQTEGELDSLISQIAGEFQGVMSRAKRGVITDKELRILADKTGMTIDDIRSMSIGTTSKAEEILAANSLFGFQAMRVKAMEKVIRAEGLGNDPETMKMFENELATLLDVEARTKGTISEAGRALRAAGIQVEGMAMGKDIADFARQINEPTGQGRQRFMNLIATLDANQLPNVAEKINKKPNAFLEIWLNAMLSGPGTLVVANNAGNAVMALNGVTERLLAGGVGAIRRSLTGTNDGVYVEEGTNMLTSMWSAATDANKAAYLMWKEGKSTTGPLLGTGDKFNLRTGRAITMDGDSMFASGIRALGHVINTPTKILVTEDEWAKMFNFQLGLRGAAIGYAKAQGLVGQEFRDEVGRIMRDPTTFAKVFDEAVDYAKQNTANRDLGKAAGAIRDWANAYPIFKMIMPFTTAPANLAYYAFERTPGLQLLSIKLWKDMGGANGPRARDLAIGKYAEGQIVGLSVAGMVYSGMITGRGPLDPQIKEDLMATGWRPYSFHPPGSNVWIPYDRIDPLGIYFGAIADSTQIMANMPKHDAETLAAGTIVAMSGVTMNKTYLQGIQGVISALDAARRGDVEGGDLRRFLDGYAASAIPSIVSSFKQANDEYFNDIRSWQDAVYDRMPGWAATPLNSALNTVGAGQESAEVYAQRDVYGRKTLRQGLFGWTPADAVLGSAFSKTGKAVEDEPGLRAIIENGVAVAPLSRSLVGPSGREIELDPIKASRVPGVKLSPKEYDQLQETLRTLEVGGMTLKQKLDDMAQNDPIFQDQNQVGPEKRQGIMLRNKILEYRKRALNEFRRDHPDVDERIRDYYRAKGDQLRLDPAVEATPGASPDSGRVMSTAPIPPRSISPGVQRLTK